ncbi:MAG: D-alanine--D-alanine ligase [Treponema sp.]|nr:D-alanine--D-alanine ligase [Treponema sp.]
MNIAVIYGGRSGEHEVSLVSASAITRNIKKDHKVILIGITKEGLWYLQDDALYAKVCSDEKAVLSITEDAKKLVSVIPGKGSSSFLVNGETLNVDVVFPALHGTYGEDGTIQGLLDMADLPYVGCTTMASALTMDKEKTKQVWQAAGLPVVPYVCLNRGIVNDSVIYDAVIKDTIKELGLPLFVKPCAAGSSNGAEKAKTEKELNFAVMNAFMWDDKVLIEKSINAREIECSVTGNSTIATQDDDVQGVTAYIPGEIIPTHEFYDYDAKYNDENGAALQIPANLSENDLEKIRKTAMAAYRVLDCSGLSRVDFFIDKDTKAVYLNEINTLPGFTPISMFPKMCEAAGLEFAELVEMLIDQAILRHDAKSKLTISR